MIGLGYWENAWVGWAFLFHLDGLDIRGGSMLDIGLRVQTFSKRCI
jgi:hypothetical protein